MKKLICFIMILALATSLFTFASAEADITTKEGISIPDESLIATTDFEDNKISLTVKSEYSFSDDIAFDGEFFGIEEIVSSKPNLPLELVLKLQEEHPDLKRTYTLTLSKHDKNLVLEIIEELEKSEYVAYANPVFVFSADADSSGFTTEQIAYIQNLAMKNELSSTCFKEDGSLNLESVADLGNNMLVFFACSEYELSMEAEVVVGNFYYTHPNVSDKLYITVNDNLYPFAKAFEDGLITNEDIQKIVDTEGTDFYRLGDINKDKKISILDVVMARSNIVEKATYDFKGDFNYDGKISILDVVLMRNEIVNK